MHDNICKNTFSRDCNRRVWRGKLKKTSEMTGYANGVDREKGLGDHNLNYLNNGLLAQGLTTYKNWLKNYLRVQV